MASTDPGVHRARLAAQLLLHPVATTPEDVVRHLLAVQAQDPRGFRLAIRPRSTGSTAADVETALTDRRSMVVSWLNRGTLHLVAAEDYWWLHPLTTPQLRTANRRRLTQEGVDPEQALRGIDVVGSAVADGPQTRRDLKDRLDAAAVPTARQALVHVLIAATLDGLTVRGPMVGGEQALVAPESWLGPPPPPLDEDVALARLARRYLAGHGPAGPPDLAVWAGITLKRARRGFAAVADEVEQRGDLVDLPGRRPVGDIPPLRLLGPFDPVLHGWPDRDPVVGAHAGIVTSNGLFRPFALVDGRAVATWGLAGGVVTLRLREAVTAGVLEALTDDAHAVLAYLRLPDSEPVVTDA